MAHLPLRAFPVLLLGTALVVGGAAARTHPTAADRVELEVAGLLPLGEGAAAVLILREKGSRTILPLVLPGGRAAAREPGAPESEGEAELPGPGLLSEAIEALGGRVAEVEIERADESRTGARVRLSQGGRTLELLGPPSESIALAISAKVPILTTRRVIDEQGLTPEDLAKLHKKARDKQHRM